MYISLLLLLLIVTKKTEKKLKIVQNFQHKKVCVEKFFMTVQKNVQKIETNLKLFLIYILFIFIF